MTADTLRAAALAWAARGFRVFRMRPLGKTPYRGWIDEATSNLDAVRALWTNAATGDAEQWNIGVLTNGLILVDVDVKHIGRVEAEMNLVDLGLDLDTLTVRTPSGGWHIYHRGPTVKSSAGKLAPGIDIRSYNSYALAPGSVTETGRYELERDVPMLEAPAHLVAACEGPRAEVPERAELPQPGEVVAAPEDQALARQELGQLLDRLRAAVPGTRNDTLNSVAFQAFGLVRAGRLEPADTQEALRDVAAEIGLEAGEIEATIGSGYRSSSAAGVSPTVEELSVDLNLPTDAVSFDLGDYAKVRAPAREWLVEGLIPARKVTFLYGDGGTGKSLISLQLATSVVTGKPWLGLPVLCAAGPVLYLSCEDDRDEILRRRDAIVNGMGIEHQDLRGLHVIDGTTTDTELLKFDREQRTTTPFRTTLDTQLQRIRPRVLILDTLADIFAGDENNRFQARAFVKELQGLATAYDTTVLVLAHPSQAQRNSGEGSAGSTGWSNSVRSRLYFEKAKTGLAGRKPDPDERVLSLKKANYGRGDREIRVRYERGYFVGQGEATAVAAKEQEMDADRVFLAGLAELERTGRTASPENGRNLAAKLISELPLAHGMAQAHLQAAMQRLYAAGQIRTVDHGPPSRRKKKIEIVPDGEDFTPQRLFDRWAPEEIATRTVELLLDMDAPQGDKAHAVAQGLVGRHRDMEHLGLSGIRELLRSTLSRGAVRVRVRDRDFNVTFTRKAKEGGDTQDWISA